MKFIQDKIDMSLNERVLQDVEFDIDIMECKISEDKKNKIENIFC